MTLSLTPAIPKHEISDRRDIGLFYVCYRLSRLGWNVMPTTRSARGIDIIAYSPDAAHFKGVQVKSLSKLNPVPFGKTLRKIMGDVWIIVNNVVSETPSTFIMLPQEVAERAFRAEKEGRVSYWLQPRGSHGYIQERFLEAWDRIKLPPAALRVES